MILFKDVTFSYKGKKENVLEKFSLNINKGDRIHISAPSGKGKTTVLRLILGLEKAKKGEITVDKDLTFSVVFQEDRLIPTESALGNVALFSSEEKAKDILCELGLCEVLNSMPSELSGGMKRRVALARALSKDFDVLILDEAFNGLDDDTMEKAVCVVEKYLNDKTLILVSHKEEEAKALKAKTAYL